MQAALGFAELQGSFAGVLKSVQKADEDTRATWAETVNQTVDKAQRKRDYTAADIANNTDNIAWQIAVLKYVDKSFDIEGTLADYAQESGINEKIAKEQARAVDAENKHSFEGYAEDGKGMYKSNFPKGTPKTAKAKVILDYIQNVWSKNPITLKMTENGVTRDIVAQFDPTYSEDKNIRTDATKLMGGNRHGTASDQRVTLDLADDYYQIASEAEYNYSKDETGKDTSTHEGVRKWHYFVNDIYFSEFDSDDYRPYRVTINVKEKSDGNFVYSFSAEAQEGSSTPQTLHAVVNGDEVTANAQPSKPIIRQKDGVVNPESEKNIDKADLAEEAAKTAQEGEKKSEGAVEGEKKEKSGEVKDEGKVTDKSSEGKNKFTESKKAETKISEKEALTDEERAERARERAEKLLKWNEEQRPTAKELNEAREYVKGFDNLDINRRMAIIRTIRSAEGKVDKKTLKGVANVMAAIPKADVEIRFAEGLGGDKGGLYTHVGNKTLLVIDRGTDFKNTIQGTIAHELVHYLENRKGYKEFAEYVMKRVKPEMKAKVTKQYTEHYKAIFAAEARKNGVAEADIEKVVAERMATDEFKALIESEIVAKYVGKALNNEKLLKKYADKDKKLIARVGEWLGRTVTSLKKNKDVDKEAVKLAEDMAFRVTVLLQSETVGESRGTKYAIKRDSKGNEYWEIDSGKDIFKGLTTPDEYRDAAFSYLISNRDNKVVVKDSNGREIIFIRVSAEEFTQSDESKDLFSNNPEMFKQKMRIVPSLDDILLHANVNWHSPDHKKHKLFKNGGFENYRGKVRIDNVIFNTIVRVGKARFGDVFYDINLEVAEYLPHTTNNSASDMKMATSNDNIIPQKSDLSTDSAKKDLSDTKADLSDKPRKADKSSDKKITIGMSDSERAEVLKNTELKVVEFKDEKAELSSEDVLKLKDTYKSQAGKIVRDLAEKFGVLADYSNEYIDLEFNYSGRSLGESIHKQNDRVLDKSHADFYDFARMLYVFEDIVKNAQPIEAHSDKYVETKRANSNLKQVYILLSAFEDGNSIIPVEFNIKEFSNGDKNKLYVSVTLQKIEVDLMEHPPQRKVATKNSKPTSTYSITDIIKNVNPHDKYFLKYIPDSLLNSKQIKAKLEALEEDRIRLDDMRYEFAVENNPEKAVWLDTRISKKTSENKKGSTQFMHYLYTPISINGAPFLAKLTVEEYDLTGKTRAYNLQRIELSDLPRAQYAQLISENKEKYAYKSDALSVAQLYDFVKRKDKKFTPAPEVSKYVLNEDGTPKVFYHGTNASFNAFSYGKIGDSSGVGILGEGFYFSDSEKFAKKYGETVKKCYLQMSNPYIASESDMYSLDTEKLSSQNYDGVIFESPNGNIYMVFDNTQIKSADEFGTPEANIGTFDGTNPDIRYSIAKKKAGQDEFFEAAVLRFDAEYWIQGLERSRYEPGEHI